MLTPTEFLNAQGLKSRAWSEVLAHIDTHLTPDEALTFARVHRAFVAYPAAHTCRTFYDFVARHGLLKIVASTRFERLTHIIESLGQTVPLSTGKRALDFGAGSGLISTWLREVTGHSVAAVDLSTASMAALAESGFPAPHPEDQFDLIVCADSLGEIHADEDDWLSEPENSDDRDFGAELEARYGFSHKLMPFKALLKSDGVVLIYEPIALDHFWQGAASLLTHAGWHVEILGPNPAWGLKLTRP